MKITNETTKELCPVCGKNFKRRQTLQLHMEIHQDDFVFCDICGKPYNSAKLFQQHKEVVHNIN